VPPFSDLGDYLAIPAVTELRLAPDGSWLAAAVQTLGPDRKKRVSGIWRVSTGQEGTGRAAPVRLTRSAEGESSPRFLPDGSLLFISRRPVPAAAKDDEAGNDRPTLWLLPAAGGEAVRIAAPPGGVAGVAAAPGAPAFLIAAAVFPGADGADDDAKRRKARKDAAVTAILHDGGPVRYWDHDLGPDCLRLLGGRLSPAAADPAATAADPAVTGEPQDLTPEPGRALDEQSFVLSPDGSVAVTGWSVQETAGETRSEIAVIDLATARRSTLLAGPGADFEKPRISPDGSMVLAIRSEHDSYQRAGDVTLVVAALGDAAAPGDSERAAPGDAAAPGVSERAAPRDLLAGLDRRPLEAAWAADGGSVYFTADDHGRRPVYQVDLASGEVTRVTTDDAAYDNLCPAPDGRTLYALRSAVNAPPAPVKIVVAGPAAGPVPLASPAGLLELPGRLEEVTATAADGAVIRAWLVLPDSASAAARAPLLLWVHGGPMMSWNAWSWRWNPHLMAARGYAVLLPDPALSTGYGREFIARGHGSWGDKPFTDLMTITDAVAARPDIDAGRTAMMGGSFGGYMANWIAGHTGRFRAIVSHASLWALDQMSGTTDGAPWFRKTFGDPASKPERYLANSPHLHADRIATPMLIIHGNNDYRVPVGEAQRLYWDLVGRGKSAKFLYFPDENHWVLKPGEVRVWYETVFAFLAEHVLGQAWQRPELL
jgi:dipeptidyl aminopeptidase/acylaminoacyl peptidase